MLVALFDTGATCSLMHADTARSLGLAIKLCLDQRITGVGGSSSVIGIVSTSVKIGKSYSDHHFLMLETPIAGYGVLVGQDFMQQVGCAIRITSAECVLEIGTDPKHLIAKIRHAWAAQA
jgi:predicted aspartyl protease